MLIGIFKIDSKSGIPSSEISSLHLSLYSSRSINNHLKVIYFKAVPTVIIANCHISRV